MDTLHQNRFVLLWIFRFGQAAWAVWHVIELGLAGCARQPEPSGGNAQKIIPEGFFLRFERAVLLIAYEQSIATLFIKAAVDFRAPVIDGDRQVHHQKSRTCAVKVNNGGEGVALKQRIVAKQIAVDHRAGQVGGCFY